MRIFYIIFIAVAFLSFVELFCKKDSNLMKLGRFVLVIALIVLSSIRGAGSGDYNVYKEVFEHMTETSGLLQVRNFFYEPIYSIIQYFTKLIVNNFQVFLFIIACIILLMEARFAFEHVPSGDVISARDFSGGISVSRGRLRIQKRYLAEKDGGIAWGSYFFTVMFLLWGLYRANVIATRSSISLSICLYATKYIEKEEFKKFILLTLIACGFHYSAAVFILAYPIFHFHSTLRVKMWIFFVGSFFLSRCIVPLASLYGGIMGGALESKISGYVTETDFMYGTGMKGSGTTLLLKAIANIGILLIMGIYLWQYNKKDRFYEGYLNLYLVGCMLYISTLTVGFAFARLSIYYNIFQIPMLLYLIGNSGKNSNKQRMTNWLLMFVYIFIRFSVNGIDTHYATFWQN